MEDIIDYKEDPVPEKGGRKWIAGMLDAIIVFVVCVLTYRFLSVQYASSWVLGVPFELLVFVAFLLYRILLLLVAGKTIGMLVLRLTYLNGHFLPLSLTERLAVSVFVMLNGADYYAEGNQ